MQDKNNLSLSAKKRKGFTLAELLVVVAIIAVLVGVAIPVFHDQTEKARNAVDMHTAKTIADAITIYYLNNPEALDELTAKCDSGLHYVQVSVSHDNAAIADILRPALNQAGLIGSYGTAPTDRFDITCQSEDNWLGYRVAVTNYPIKAGEPRDLQIYFWGVSIATKVHSTNTLGAYRTSVDPTGFKEAMRGA